MMQSKAESNDFLGRFREIVSDPLNLAISKDSRAGLIDGDFVYLHNGLKVSIAGPYAYYAEFSSILVINSGVHEPLEEFVFQQLLKQLPNSPTMIELGAYWGHYSMWLKKTFPEANIHLVEPDLDNLQVGMYNFELNEIDGEFIHAFVGQEQFEVDKYLAEESIQKLSILHSDIQGYEIEMLAGCSKALTEKCIDYVFISTHSQELHLEVIKHLQSFGYRVEVSSDFDNETTSFDGFVFASSPLVECVFNGFIPMGRTQLLQASPTSIATYLSQVVDIVQQPNSHSKNP